MKRLEVEPIRFVLLAALAVAVAGCNPYMAAVSAVSATYGVARDPLAVSTQASDAEIEAQIKTALVASPVPGTGTLNVFITQGVVVLAGVVTPGSAAGSAAVQVARETPGVRRIETFFVPYQPSILSDLDIKAHVKAAFVADPRVVETNVDVGVYAGHVVLVGAVDSYQKVNDFIADAQSVNGVVSVRSYLQVVA
jgi:hyperosmotically inducible protein